MTTNSWNNNASEWTKRIRGGMDLSREVLLYPTLLEQIGYHNPRRILDAGSGEGTFSSRVSEKLQNKIVSVDLSIEMCRQQTTLNKERVFTINGNVEELPFQSFYFDLVVANMLLSSLEKIDKVLIEFARVLKPSGICLFSILNSGRVIPRDVSEQFDFDSGTINLISDYTVERRVEALLRVGDRQTPLPYTTPYFHRKLSTYFAALVKSGFVVTNVSEPVPSEIELSTHPDMANYWLLAPFLIISSRKES